MSMSGAGSEKGLPKKPRKEATTSPHPEPIDKLGTENDPQLREGVWAALAPGTAQGQRQRSLLLPKMCLPGPTG